jgi:hypothetical protein
MSTKLPDVVSRYFERDADRDIDSIVGLFAEDATVIDEGEERHGTAKSGPGRPAQPRNTPTRPKSRAPKHSAPTATCVTGRLTGNFPGGTADLKWDFTIAGQHITKLVIAP